MKLKSWCPYSFLETQPCSFIEPGYGYICPTTTVQFISWNSKKKAQNNHKSLVYLSMFYRKFADPCIRKTESCVKVQSLDQKDIRNQLKRVPSPILVEKNNLNFKKKNDSSRLKHKYIMIPNNKNSTKPTKILLVILLEVARVPTLC